MIWGEAKQVKQRIMALCPNAHQVRENLQIVTTYQKFLGKKYNELCTSQNWLQYIPNICIEPQKILVIKLYDISGS
jgi:hypothetical protein